MKRSLIFLLALALLLGAAGPVYSAGDAGDPVVSLSYLDEVFTPSVRDTYTVRINSRLGMAYHDSLRGAADALAAERLTAQQAASGTDRRAAGVVLLKQGDVLTLVPGCKVTLKAGSVRIDASGLVDVTNGKTADKGAAMAQRTLYMMGAGDGELCVQSATCELTVDGVYRLAPGTSPDYGSMALALKKLGLFRGGSTGLDLERGASRAEGLVMFLRLLGLEDEALAYQGDCPFTDVPKTHWACRYVAYAYAEGLTTGTGGGRFSPDAAITCQQYATFLLRALHYREKTDFTYQNAVRDLTTLGLFSEAETASLSTGTFWRYRMVYLSYYALFGVDQSTGRLLMNELVSSGAVTDDALTAALAQVVGGPIV